MLKNEIRLKFRWMIKKNKNVVHVQESVSKVLRKQSSSLEIKFS